MQQARRATDHGGQARYAEPGEEDAVMVRRWHGRGSQGGHDFDGEWTLTETGLEFEGLLTCGPHDNEGNHISRDEAESFETR
jgi:hypothetical protein